MTGAYLKIGISTENYEKIKSEKFMVILFFIIFWVFFGFENF